MIFYHRSIFIHFFRCLFYVSFMMQFLSLTLSKILMNYVWPVPCITGWLTVTFSELFKASSTRFFRLCDSNSWSLIPTGGNMNSWFINGQNTSNWHRFDVDIKLILQKENIDFLIIYKLYGKYTNFHVIFTNLFDVITCFVQRNFYGQ